MTDSVKYVLFAGGYCAADQPGIHAFSFDAVGGALTLLGSFTGIANPSFLVIHPNGRWLYAVSEIGMADNGRHGEVWAFRIQRPSLALEPINRQSTNGDWPCHLEIDANGRWLIASNYGSGDVAVFPIQEDGSIGELNDFVQHEGHGPDAARQEGPHAHSATAALDNRFVIVADLGIDQLVVYAFDEETGKLTPHDVAQTRPAAGPRHATFSENGCRLYVANELDSTVTVYEYDVENGSLSALQTLDTLPPGAPENIVADIHLSFSGQRLYVSNRGHHSVAVYRVDGEGLLSLRAIPSCGGKWPRNFILSPDGRYLLAANERSSEISTLPVMPDETELGVPLARTKVGQPTCLQWLM